MYCLGSLVPITSPFVHTCTAYPAWASCPIVLGLMVLVEVLFLVEDIGDNDDKKRWLICLVAPAYAMQNNLTFGGSMAVHTTIITGNFQKVGIAIFKMLTGECMKNLKAVWKPIVAILFTFAGAAAGAWYLMEELDNDPKHAFVPATVLQCIIFILHDVFFRKKTE